jgi:hypothetical protein
MMNQIVRIVKALVNASHGDLMADLQSDELEDWENDEDWLEHLKRSVERLEQRLSVLDAISSEDLHDSWKRLQEESPEYGAFPVERYLDQIVTSLREKFRKALFFAIKWYKYIRSSNENAIVASKWDQVSRSSYAAEVAQCQQR